MQDSRLDRTKGRQGGRTGLFLALAAAAIVVVSIVAAGLWDGYRRRTQMQNDPRVARVWVNGVTFGPYHELKRGSSMQQWLNSHNISLLGDYQVLQGQYARDPGSIEMWFGYESYLVGRPELECHRVWPGGTAFTDDLGQVYHGFLDIHDRSIGVYLPGYDHSAREIRCALKWMPRRPAAPQPESEPMKFTIRLPVMRRELPPGASLPRTVTQRKGGITVTVNAARIGPFKRAQGAIGQRDMTFHLKIDGGEIANDNVATELNLDEPDPARVARIRTAIGAAVAPVRPSGATPALQAQGQLMAFINPTFSIPLTIVDPYGIPLIVPGQAVAALVSRDALDSARRGEGVRWRAPVNNAGKGTDAVRLHLDVYPKPMHGKIMLNAPVPFDLVVPVQTGDEI